MKPLVSVRHHRDVVSSASGDTGDLGLRLKQELTKLGWLDGPTGSYYFARRAQRRGASSDRAAASTRLSVPVYIEPLSANAAAGREAEEMFKTGCQCVSVSVTPDLVRNAPSSPVMLIRRV